MRRQRRIGGGKQWKVALSSHEPGLQSRQQWSTSGSSHRRSSGAKTPAWGASCIQRWGKGGMCRTRPQDERIRMRMEDEGRRRGEEEEEGEG